MTPLLERKVVTLIHGTKMVDQALVAEAILVAAAEAAAGTAEAVVDHLPETE
jgi:hypothetical protein